MRKQILLLVAITLFTLSAQGQSQQSPGLGVQFMDYWVEYPYGPEGIVSLLQQFRQSLTEEDVPFITSLDVRPLETAGSSDGYYRIVGYTTNYPEPLQKQFLAFWDAHMPTPAMKGVLANIDAQIRKAEDDLKTAEQRLAEGRRDLAAANLERIGKRARIEATREQIKQLTEAAKAGSANDEISQQLEEAVKLLEEQLQTLQKNLKAGTAQPPEINAARLRLLEAKVQLAQRREAVAETAGGKVLQTLQDENVHLAIDDHVQVVRIMALENQVKDLQNETQERAMALADRNAQRKHITSTPKLHENKTLAPGDVIEITVKDPSKNGEKSTFRLEVSETAVLPNLPQPLRPIGLMLGELEKEATKAYGKPVSIRISPPSQCTYFMYGQVPWPGAYGVREGQVITFGEALREVGIDPTNPYRITLTRRNVASPVVKVDLQTAPDKKTLDIQLQNGDVIWVNEDQASTSSPASTSTQPDTKDHAAKP